MFVYKKLKPSDVSITPFEAHKQYSYDSSSAGSNGLTFYTAQWTSESKAHYSVNNLAGNFLNHRNYFQLDKIFYRNYITDHSNLIPDVNYIDQERRLYDKVNILSIPQNLFGSRIQPTTFDLTGSFNNGNTIIEIKDDGEGNIYPTSYTLGSDNWPSEKGRIVYIGPVHGFKKKDITVDNKTGNKIVNGPDTFTLKNVYDDSYYLNQVDYNNVTFTGDTPLLGLNFKSDEGGYLRLDHSELYNFGFEDDFSISFYLDYNPIHLYDELAGFTTDSDHDRRVIAKADIKTIIPSPGEGRSETLSTFTSGNLQPIDIPAENKWPFKIELDIRASDGSGSLSFSRSTGTQTVTITDPVAIFVDPGGSEFITSKLVHICCQKKDDELIIYRNGIKVASGSDLDPNLCKGIPPTNEANVYVGMKPTLELNTSDGGGGEYSKDYGTNFLSGNRNDIKLSQLMIWDSALSETQIQNVSESITGTPYIGNIFYDEGFVTINHPSYSDVLQQYSGSLTQDLTLLPTFGDEYNYDEVINVVDTLAWTASITAYNEENKIWSKSVPNFPEFSLFEDNYKIEDSGFTKFKVKDYEQVWNGTFKIQKLSQSIFDFDFESDTATENPFTVSGSNINFIDKSGYLLLSSSATTNTQNVTILIDSSSLLFEDFIVLNFPNLVAPTNISQTEFGFTSENDGGIAEFFYDGGSDGFMYILGENNQVHKYDGLGIYKTTANSQDVDQDFEVVDFNSSFAYSTLTLGGGTPQVLGNGGIVADFSNDDIEINPVIDQAIHDGTQIYIQAFLTVEPEPDFTQNVTMQLQRNQGSSWFNVQSATFQTNPLVNQTQTILYGPITPQSGDKFRLRARSISSAIGPNNATIVGGTGNSPNTFLRAVNQTVDPGFKNFASVESDTWTTSAEGYYKVRIEKIRTDNDNYPNGPDHRLNRSSTGEALGVAIQILKNNNPIYTEIIPKDTNYGTFEHDFIETSTGGTYKIKLFICKDDGTDNPPLRAFASDQGFQIGQVEVYGREKTNIFNITPALSEAFEAGGGSNFNTNNSNFTFNDEANLVPDNTLIGNITNNGTIINLTNSYTITSSLGATASYDEQQYISASATLTVSESGIYEITDFEIGQDETTNLPNGTQPRLRLNTNRNGTVTTFGPFVGSQNVNQLLGVLTGSDTINMHLDLVQNFGTPATPIYNIVQTGNEVGFSVDNLNIDGLFPTNSITLHSGPDFPSTIDEIRFFSPHGFNQGNPDLPFSTGSITASVTYINGSTLTVDSATVLSGSNNIAVAMATESMFITASATGTGWNQLTDNPISASLSFPGKIKSLYTFKLGTIFGGLLTGSATHIAAQLFEPGGTLVTESLYDISSGLVSTTFIENTYFTASENGDFKLNIFSSDNSYNAADVSGSTSYIQIFGDITSSILSGSRTLTKVDGEDFLPTTLGIAISSSHTDEGQFAGGAASASFTTGNLDTTMVSYISPTQITVPEVLFITASSDATGSVNLGDVYYQYTGSVGTTTTPIGPILEGNFTIGDTTYNLNALDGGILSITPEILITELTDITLNYHTTASHDYNVKFKNSHLIFEHEYQCSVDEEEFNYTQNVSVRKNKSNQSADLADCVTGSLDNSQITLFKPYVTSVGLYDDNYNLLAVGKFAQPIKMSEETDMTFVIRWDS